MLELLWLPNLILLLLWWKFRKIIFLLLNYLIFSILVASDFTLAFVYKRYNILNLALDVLFIVSLIFTLVKYFMHNPANTSKRPYRKRR